MTEFKAAIFDWAGTTVDFGSFAPMGVFIQALAHFGIEATVEDARAPMGAPKWDHIDTLLKMPRLRQQWEDTYDRTPTDSDVDDVFRVFVPLNETVAADYADLIPGTLETMAALRAKGMKIGSTTGYTRSIMENVLPVAKAQGYDPDCLVCSDDLAEGRPGPLGIYKCMVELAVYPPSALIKVDDTAPGIAEGVSAGCLTVGVALSGNAVGKTLEELRSLTDEEISRLRKQASDDLFQAGSDHVIDTIADLPDLLRHIT
jgi:phosphonoacetaldehyde hydrolase